MLQVKESGVFRSSKILSLEEIRLKIAALKNYGKKVGLCHGGFDLLHPGHIKHFESAKKLCDVLVVSVTSNRFVASRKGAGRPVLPDTLRAYSIACLEFVDFVVITDVAKGVEVIEQLKPSYYIKGPDFIHKTTPGIMAEREAIARVGGEVKYTDDPALSTTRIIDYIKNELDVPNILLIIDRDGTIIQNDDFFGKHDNWKEELKFNEEVLSFLSYLQTKYKTTKIIVTNQSGVARRYFDCAKVEEINAYIHKQLALKGLKIDNWQYCPDVDSAYARSKKGELTFDQRYVKDETKRKPSLTMVEDALRELQRVIMEFSSIVVIGNSDDDKKIAEKLQAGFIDIRGKRYGDLIKEL